MAIKPVVIKLEEPITLGEGDKATTYTELTFARKLKGKDLIAMDAVQGDTRKSFAMYASMAGVPIQVMMELDSDTFEDLALEVAPLMGKRGQAAAEAIKKKLAEQDRGGEAGADTLTLN